MSRARPLFVGSFKALTLLGTLLGSAGIASGPAACGSTSSADSLPPITGVTVRAESLTAGLGCGPKATQVLKYLVVAFGANPADTNAIEKRYDEFLAASIYDCFADGQLVELPISGGSSRYELQVYAYNAAAYAAAGGDAALKAITARLAALRAAMQVDGGADNRSAIAAELAALGETNPTYSTTCDATQFPNVQSLAVCEPLSLGATSTGATVAPARAVLSTASFPGPDGGVVTCDDQYVSVRYRYSASRAASPFTAPAESRCSTLTSKGLEPFVITVSPAVAPASYVFELALLRSDGSTFGLTTCGAETSPGLTSAAVCQPVQ